MINYDLLIKMHAVRLICAKGHALRADAGIPLRQPLASLSVSTEFVKKCLVEGCEKYGVDSSMYLKDTTEENFKLENLV